MEGEQSEDEMHIIAGVPVRAEVYQKIAPYLNQEQEDMEEFEGRHHGRHHKGGRHHGKEEKNGKEHHGHGKHHKKRCCIVTKILGFALLASHFFFIHKLKKAQEVLEKLTGVEKPNWGCGKWRKAKWGKCGKKNFQQPAQQVVVSQPVYAQNEIHEEQDKQESFVYAPA